MTTHDPSLNQIYSGVIRSTIYLAYPYRVPADESGRWLSGFHQQLVASKVWEERKNELDTKMLLPHLDSVKHGDVFRYYESTGNLAQFFRDDVPWNLLNTNKKPKDKSTIKCHFTGKIRLFAFESGYLFLVFQAKAEDKTLSAHLDLVSALVRGLNKRLHPDAIPDRAKLWKELYIKRYGTPPSGNLPPDWWTLRKWGAALLPASPVDSATDSRTGPVVFCSVQVPEPLPPSALRKVHYFFISSSEEKENNQENKGILKLSDKEHCLANSLGVTWLEEGDSLEKFDKSNTRISQVYLYEWLLVQHQRLLLLDLSTQCARIPKSLHPPTLDKLRLELLRYSTRYNFSQVSDEERFEDFYEFIRKVLDIEVLSTEVKEEILETSEYIKGIRSERLNHVMAYLTLVVAPLGLVIGIFQRETLPVYPISVISTLNHRPFQFIFLVALLGLVLAYILASPGWFNRRVVALQRLTRRENSPSHEDLEG